MFRSIMVPVDLNHVSQQTKALDAAGRLALAYGIVIHLVSVSTQPRPEGVSADAFGDALVALAQEQTEKTGARVLAHPIRTDGEHADLDVTLKLVATDLGCDLVVMASHVPGFREYIFASNAGYLATHSDLSVFVVR